MINFKCRNCGFDFQFSEDKAGKKAKCRNCGKVFVIPGGKPEPVVPAEPPIAATPQAAAVTTHVHHHTQEGIGNGAAAILTFFVPGLGQMCQGRVGLGVAALILVPFGYLLFIVPGLVAHLISIVDAATYKGR